MATPSENTAGARLLTLARTALGTLQPAEARLIHGAASEQDVVCGTDLPWISATDNVDADAARWGAERSVRAEVIRWLCVDQDASALVDPKGIRLHGARILGQLDLGHIAIPFPVELHRCRLAEGCRLVGFHAGRLVLEGSWTGPITADGAEIKQSLYLSHGFRCDGTVSLVMVQIGATLVCEGACFSAPGDVALYADGVSVAGDLLLRADTDEAGKFRPFQAEGKISLIGAKIGGDVDCTDARLVNPGGEAINLQRTAIGGALVFSSDTKTAPVPFKTEGKIDLEFASARVFVSPETCWPGAGELVLNGFSYSGLDDAKDAATQLRWLRLDTTNPPPTQPYSQLSKVLLDSGDADGSKLVLKAKERALTKGWMKLVKAPIGYGYNPGRAVWGLVLLTALGAFLFRHYAGQMIYSGDAAAHMPHFQPLAYSFENTFPLVKLGQVDKWQPNPDVSGLAHYLRWIVWGQTVLGWIFATLFVAAVSGIVQHGD